MCIISFFFFFFFFSFFFDFLIFFIFFWKKQIKILKKKKNKIKIQKRQTNEETINNKFRKSTLYAIPTIIRREIKTQFIKTITSISSSNWQINHFWSFSSFLCQTLFNFEWLNFSSFSFSFFFSFFFFIINFNWNFINCFTDYDWVEMNSNMRWASKFGTSIWR